jgi:hypothetical protein
MLHFEELRSRFNEASMAFPCVFEWRLALIAESLWITACNTQRLCHLEMAKFGGIM